LSQKVKKRRPPYAWLGEENVELLKRHFGSVRKGLKELVQRYAHSLGPRDRVLRVAYHALLQEAEKSEAMPYRHSIEVIKRAVGCGDDEALDIFRKLMTQAYLDWDRERRGWVRILAKRSDFAGLEDVLPSWMLKG